MQEQTKQDLTGETMQIERLKMHQMITNRLIRTAATKKHLFASMCHPAVSRIAGQSDVQYADTDLLQCQYLMRAKRAALPVA